jgi:hypothetical protein
MLLQYSQVQGVPYSLSQLFIFCSFTQCDKISAEKGNDSAGKIYAATGGYKAEGKWRNCAPVLIACDLIFNSKAYRFAVCACDLVSD